MNKEYSLFGVCKSRYDGLQKICKQCSKEYRDAHKDKTKEYNKKYHTANKDKAVEASKQYYNENKEIFIELAHKRYTENKKEILEKAKIYYINNKKEISKKKIIYIQNRLLNDPFFKLKMNIRTLIKNSFKNAIKNINSNAKKNTKTTNILGCTFAEFKIHLEKQFDDKMNWDNQGSYWHMDHIKPISLAQTVEEAYQLNHYTNFQPLEKFANLSKSNKY